MKRITIFFQFLILLAFANSAIAGGGHEHEHGHDHEEDHDKSSTEISPNARNANGMQIEKVGAAAIPSELHLNGKVFASEHKIAHIIPRFPGIVKEGKKHIGDRVEKGETLAVIESNQSLQPYEIKSQITGVIVAGHLIVGEYVPENQWVFIVADLSEVWVDFYTSEHDAEKIKVQSKVSMNLEDKQSLEGKIIYVTPFADEKTQMQVARASVDNSEGKLKPGMFISGTITFSEKQVPLAVKTEAIQTFRNSNVVFIKVDNTYEAKPLTLGMEGGGFTEVISGIQAGDEYVTEQSYLVKADILKSGAAHDH